MGSAAPWYRRPLGITALTYLIVTGGLGIVFLIVTRDGASAERLAASGNFTRTGVPPPAVAQPTTPLLLPSAPALGAERPAVTIVEFADFECPFCKRAYPVIRAAAAQYGDRLRVVFRDFPIEALHPTAHRAAEAARCAADQDKFWPYHDRLYQFQDAHDDASLTAYADQVGMDREAFTACLVSGRHRTTVQRDLDTGRDWNVRGTPTWFILLGEDEASARRVEGVMDHAALSALLDGFTPVR